MPSILLFGVTGFIGGSLLTKLRISYPNSNISALVRNPTHNNVVLAAGVSTIINTSESLADTYKSIEKAIVDPSAKVMIVINCASSRDAELNSMILKAMRIRFDEGMGKGILIHTSGTGTFMDGTMDGRHDPAGKIFSDETEEDMRSITINHIHGSVDVPIFKAGEEGYVNAYIISPASIYGRGTGPIGTVGAQQHIIDRIKSLGYSFYTGEGSNVFGAVHLDDLMDLYALVLKKAINDQKLPKLPESSYARYYIASTELVPWKNIMSLYGRILHQRGLIMSPLPRSVSVEDAGAFGRILCGNSQTKSVRSLRDLGWRPREITLSSYEEIVDEAIKTYRDQDH